MCLCSLFYNPLIRNFGLQNKHSHFVKVLRKVDLDYSFTTCSRWTHIRTCIHMQYTNTMIKIQVYVLHFDWGWKIHKNLQGNVKWIIWSFSSLGSQLPPKLIMILIRPSLLHLIKIWSLFSCFVYSIMFPSFYQLITGHPVRVGLGTTSSRGLNAGSLFLSVSYHVDPIIDSLFFWTC